MGVEVKEPIINEQALNGITPTRRSGWQLPVSEEYHGALDVQECKRVGRQGENYEYEDQWKWPETVSHSAFIDPTMMIFIYPVICPGLFRISVPEPARKFLRPMKLYAVPMRALL